MDTQEATANLGSNTVASELTGEGEGGWPHKPVPVNLVALGPRAEDSGATAAKWGP